MRKRTSNPDEDDHGASALTRGLSILRAFRPGDGTLGNLDLIARTGLPKATVSRLTGTLVGLGYLAYDENIGRYSIGPATVSLGYGGLGSMPVVHMAQPLLQGLAERSGVAAALGTRSGLDMIYLATRRASGPVSLQLDVGSSLPVWRTAMGLAYVTALDTSARDAFVERLVEREPDEAGAIHIAVARALEETALRGFVSTFGTWHGYINAVGASFRPSDGSPLVAMNCGGISNILTREACLGAVGAALLEAIGELRRRLEGESAGVCGDC